jgi:steroid delta-isomerase-like uncharacterized protein
MDPIEIVQRYEEHWSATGDRAAMVAWFAPGGTYTAPGADALTGEAIGRFAQVFVDAFPECRLEVDTIFAAGDQVAATWVWRSGPMKGDLPGLPANGASAVVRGIHVIRVEGDKLRTVEAIWDNHALFAQLGAG